MKENVSKSLAALEVHVDAKLATITQKIEAIEPAQGELNRKVETIKNQAVETVAKVDNLESKYGKLQAEHTKLKEDIKKLHNILENVDNRARWNNLRLAGLKEGKGFLKILGKYADRLLSLGHRDRNNPYICLYSGSTGQRL